MRLAGRDEFTPVYVISVAAELAGMHAQTLRQYDRLGLVTPSRTGGGGRRYSDHDVNRLRQVQSLSQEGVSLAGIQRIMRMEHQVEALQQRVTELTRELEQVQRREPAQGARVFAARGDGQIVELPAGGRVRDRQGRALVPWRAPAGHLVDHERRS